MKKNRAKKPLFLVIYNEYGNDIQFKNIFEFGQLTSIIDALKKIKKKLNAAYGKDDEKYRKLIDKIIWDDKKRKKKYTPDELLEIELRRKCMYYFWAKCEYEVIVTGWPDTKTEKKIDIYQQLDANWDIFKTLVFESL